MKTELLAPARDKETAIEAINCGADAIYMGAFAFGARTKATNTLEDIQEVVEYAHKFWVKVFVTVNTILTDDELKSAIELVKSLDKIGVDAIIVQDMGLLECIIEIQEKFAKGESRENISIPIHMSTQCDNRVSDKIQFFNNIGVNRVVLARELSLEQIRKIHEANPNAEIEAFVHGALCVSYSGQCYLSQYIGGRSANRGECAQPCRKKYTVETVNGKIIAKNIHALCLKDFNASKHLQSMIDSGVYSFKIEGRLKEVGYVKNITAYYRHELNKFSEQASSGQSFYEFVPNLEKSFNRGFTDYFLEKRKDCFNFLSPKSRGEYIGKVIYVKNNELKLKTNLKLNAQDGLTNGIDGCLINKMENGLIFANKNVDFKKGDDIYRNVDVEFEKLLCKPVKRQIAVDIHIDRSIQVIDEDGIIVCMDLPKGEKAKNVEKIKEIYKKQFSKTGQSDFYLRNMYIDSELPFLPVSELNDLRRKLLANLMVKRIAAYQRDVQKKLCYTKYYKNNLDYRANVHNSKAKIFYEKCESSVKEMSLESKLPSSQLELMRTKHCIKYALGMCKSTESLLLRDDQGKTYPLKFDCKNCEMVVLNK